MCLVYLGLYEAVSLSITIHISLHSWPDLKFLIKKKNIYIYIPVTHIRQHFKFKIKKINSMNNYEKKKDFFQLTCWRMSILTKAAIRNRHEFEILLAAMTKHPLTLTQQCDLLNYSGLQFLLKVANVRGNYTMCFLAQITLTTRLKQCTPRLMPGVWVGSSGLP